MIQYFFSIRNKWGLTALAGVLLGFSFSPFPFPFLLFPAFIILFRLAALTNTYREACYYSYPAFLIWNLIATYWLTMATVIGGIAAILANSAIMALVFGLMALVQKRFLNSIYRWILAAAVWVSYEWLHLHWDLAWPWLILANAWAPAPYFVQYIEYTGFLSISFLMVICSGWLYEAMKTHHETEFPFLKVREFKTAAGVFMASVVISLIILLTTDLHPEDTVHTVVAQPNYDSYLPLGGYQDNTTPLLELTAKLDTVVTSQTQMMFWPENALMGRVDERSLSYNDRHIFNKAQEWDVTIVTGAMYFRYYIGEQPPRVHRIDGSGNRFNFFNSAVGYYPDETRSVYKKIRLVPIVERLPFVTALSYLPLPVDWGDVSGYGKGRDMKLFYTPDRRVSSPAVVCYDSVFPSVVRRSVVKGAGFITVITNDGWWGRTSGHIQHYDFARLRAIETRRAVVRSANNGISGMIMPDGTAHTKTEYWTRTAFELAVPVYSRQTFYVKFGNWFPITMLLIALFGLFKVFFGAKKSQSAAIR